jgi:DNA-binding NarL/FixJ family response regulator
MSTAPIRVLIADDHFVVRRGIGALLASLDSFVVVAGRRPAWRLCARRD